MGIKPDWRYGPIICSEQTARLITHILGVDSSVLNPLPLNTPTTLPCGVQVTLIDANHCPGAVQFLFRLPDGRKIVHTGDFRFSADQMLTCPNLADFKGADAVYLDTTYANPKYKFAPQEESVEYVASTIYRLLQEDRAHAHAHAEQPGSIEIVGDSSKSGTLSSQQPIKPSYRRLFLISTYVIGKERILKAVADRCGVKIYTSDRKAKVMACLDGLPEGLFTSDPSETPVHVTPWGFLGDTWPFFRPNWKTPAEYAGDVSGAESFVGFVPTGWVHGMAKDPFPVKSKGDNVIHLVPYSEHSSYDELMEFVGYLRPAKVIPTVLPSNDDGGRAIDRLLRRFTLVTDQDAAKAKFIAMMGGSSKPPPAKLQKKPQGELQGEPIKDADISGIDCTSGEDVVAEQEESMKKVDEIEEESGAVAVIDPGDAQQAQQEEEADVIELLDDDEDDQIPMDSDLQGSDPAVSPSGGAVEMLIGLTDGALTAQQAQQLLNAASGDVPRAADMYFDGRWKQVLASTSIKRPYSASSNKLSGKQQPSAAAAGAASPTLGRSKAKVGTKRRRSDASGVTNLAPGQKSILSFFSGTANKNSSAVPVPGGTLPTPAANIATNFNSNNSDHVKKEALPDVQGLKRAQEGEEGLLVSPPPAKKPAALMQFPRPSTAAAAASAHAAPRDAVALPLHQYHPVLHAPWSPGQPTPYLHIARAFQAMDGTTKRLAISDILVNMFRSILALSPDDLPSSAYLSVGKIAPDYEQGMELSVGGSTVAGAISEATGVTRSRLRELYNVMGDLGDVAATCKRTQSTLARPAPLTVAGVHAALRGIAAEQGTGATRRRQAAVLSMLRSCREAETKYLVRTLVQALRVGANWRSVVPALAKAILIHSAQAHAIKAYLEEESAPSSSAAAAASASRPPPPLPALPSKSELDAAGAAASAAFHVCPNLDLLIAAMLEGPMATLEERCRLTFGVPIKPMLAKISEGVEDAIRQLKGAPFVAEYKYDGVRAQIHLRSPQKEPQGNKGGDGIKATDDTRSINAGNRKGNDSIDKTASKKGSGDDVSAKGLDGLPDVMIFSRNSEDRTASFPDVAAQVIEAAAGGAVSCILDAEVVAVDRGNNSGGGYTHDPTKAGGGGGGGGGGGTSDSTTIHGSTIDISTMPDSTTTTCTKGNYPPNSTNINGVLRLRPFQDLASRPRGVVDRSLLTVDVCVFVFDILELNGVSLLGLPLRERRAALLQALPGLRPGYVQLAQGFEIDRKKERPEELQIAEVTAAGTAGAETFVPGAVPAESSDPLGVSMSNEEGNEESLSDADLDIELEQVVVQKKTEHSGPGGVDAAAGTAAATAAGGSDLLDPGLVDRVQGWLLNALAAGTEGLMLKSLDAAYQPSRRSEHWIKLKKDYCDALHDTLDLVVIGAWHGSGRKAGWYSPFLLAVYDPESEQLQSLCRCMSGFSDEFYKAATARLKETIIPTKRPYYVTQETPDVWFDAKEVWEVRGAELSLSPVHKAGIGKIPGSERGAGLRFPRFLRIREDKAVEEATSADAVAAMYEAQESG